MFKNLIQADIIINFYQCKLTNLFLLVKLVKNVHSSFFFKILKKQSFGFVVTLQRRINITKIQNK